MLEDDDLSVWQAEIADVKPRTVVRPKQAKNNTSDDVEELFAPTVERVATDVIEDIELEASAISQTSLPPLFVGQTDTATASVSIQRNSADVISGWANGIDKRTMKKLAAGQIAFEDRLDLHGFYETQAWAAVQDFLHEAYGAEHRCVLVIHGKGKGYGEAGDMGVIKANMAGWLVQHPRVLAFHTAHKKDGGRGAIYVYLRRQK